jgi:hypothetical protein
MAIPAVTLRRGGIYFTPGPRPLLLELDAFRTPDFIVNRLGGPSPTTTVDLVYVARRIIGQRVRLQCAHGDESLARETAGPTFLDLQLKTDSVLIRQQALVSLRPPRASFVAERINQTRRFPPNLALISREASRHAHLPDSLRGDPSNPGNLGLRHRALAKSFHDRFLFLRPCSDQHRMGAFDPFSIGVHSLSVAHNSCPSNLAKLEPELLLIRKLVS